jgi:RND family efflux transporter MFP subunit
MSQRAAFGIRAAIVVVILLVALVIFQVLAGSKPIVPTVDPDQQHQRVNVVRVTPVQVQRQWKGYGTAEAIDSANVPARVTATVEHLPDEVLEGAAVSKGQLLVELDDSDFSDQLKIAQQNLAAVDARLAELDTLEAALTERLTVETADRDLARDELDRVKAMFQKNAANQKDVDAAERTYLAAQRNRLQVQETLSGIGPRRDQLLAEQAGLKSQADIARENLARCSIKSPLNGVLQSVDVEVGESVAPGERVARVVSLDRVQTPLSLPAQARAYVGVGDTVRLTSSADPNLSWQATVERIAPEDDPTTRTFAVYVIVDQAQREPSPDGKAYVPLTPGVFVRGIVIGTEENPRLVVPRRSIRTERVMLVRDGVIQTSQVQEDFLIEGRFEQLGLPDEYWTVVSGGVDDGDLVIINPIRSLSDGQKVEPVVMNDKAERAQPTALGVADGESLQGDVK